MSVSLRAVVNEDLNLETEETLSDAVMLRQYRRAVNWYRKYRLFPRTNTYNYSIESGDYVPDMLLTSQVEYEGKTVKLSSIVDTETRVFNGTGTISVTIALNANNAYLAGLPNELEQLFVAYCKREIGQRLKFSSYESQPFTLDGDNLYKEGDADAKAAEAAIQINRDEDPNNITDLRKENYNGVKGIWGSPGMYLW